MQLDQNSLLSNPVVLGAIVFALVHLAKRMGWSANAKETLWLAMATSLGIATIDALTLHAFVPLPMPVGLNDPLQFIVYLGQAAQALCANAGVILASSQVIYHVLHSQLILGDKV